MSIQLLLFPLQHNFASAQLSHYLFLSPHCHQINSETKLADNAKSRRRASYMYRVTKKHNAQNKNKHINSHSAKLN